MIKLTINLKGAPWNSVVRDDQIIQDTNSKIGPFNAVIAHRHSAVKVINLPTEFEEMCKHTPLPSWMPLYQWRQLSPEEQLKRHINDIVKDNIGTNAYHNCYTYVKV